MSFLSFLPLKIHFLFIFCMSWGRCMQPSVICPQAVRQSCQCLQKWVLLFLSLSLLCSSQLKAVVFPRQEEKSGKYLSNAAARKRHWANDTPFYFCIFCVFVGDALVREEGSHRRGKGGGDGKLLTSWHRTVSAAWPHSTDANVKRRKLPRERHKYLPDAAGQRDKQDAHAPRGQNTQDARDNPGIYLLCPKSLSFSHESFQ